MPGRFLAISDIHGCLAALQTILQAIGPQPDDTIIPLGDYVDRGPDSQGVIDELIALGRRCRLIPILGNHDEIMRDICEGQSDLYDDWLVFGGDATVGSYDGLVPEAVPPEHVAFLQSCRPFYETERHFFVHGNYWPAVPLEAQSRMVLRWESLKMRRPGPHISGKIAIVGHTAQKSGEILDLGYLKCIDTCCYGSGWLTAMDMETGQTWQADKRGKMRREGDTAGGVQEGAF
ncbi:MAG: serine/threonine protein phosphatase [Pirellulales bacterium]|nr:serine/threonine protein phosphatase [Pirellulales bacterium]